MIISFGNSETEKIWDGERVKKIPNEIQNVAAENLECLIILLIFWT